jgi:uncharacterized protein YdhG (YjbR/CyaY superfamily)
MKALSNKFETVDEYISKFTDEIKDQLEKLRKIIKQAAPNATEVISYNMPAYKQNGVLVYFAANKNHIGFYPTGSPIIAFKEQLELYNTSKGAIQFPLDKPLPVALIKNIVKYRLSEDLEKAKAKKKK